MTTDVAAPAPAPAPAHDRRWGVRSIAALLIFVIAALFTPVALVGHWGHRTVIDSERYIATVGPLIEQPEVQQALSTAVTDAVVQQVNTQDQVQQLLGNLNVPEGLSSALSAPIAAGINSLIGDLVTRFIASDQFKAVWIRLNTAVQKGLVAVLEGGNGGPVQIQGDTIVLDISSALGVIQQYLVESGISAAANITIPQTDRQVELANVQGLGQIRTIYALTSPILQWFPLIIAAMFALSIALARRRARTVVATGIVLVATAVLIDVALNIGDTEFTNQLAGTPFGPASQVFWDTLLEYLILGVQAVLALGVVLILAGWFGGRTALARRLRGPVVRGLDEIGDRVPGAQPFRRWLASYAMWVRWGIYAVVLLILLASDVLSRSTIVWAAALAAGLVTLVQVLADVPDEEAGATPAAVPDDTVVDAVPAAPASSADTAS